MPPIVTALRTGVHVGAGTDAHRVASYNPFVALQWMLDGKTVGGLPTRGPDETPSREDALRLYTVGSAWFCFDETRRGTLEAGKLADFVDSRSGFHVGPRRADRRDGVSADGRGRQGRLRGGCFRERKVRVGGLPCYPSIEFEH